MLDHAEIPGHSLCSSAARLRRASVPRSAGDDDGTQDDDGDGVPDEVVEVGTVLWENSELYFVLFSYYAAIGGDVYSLSLNEWSTLLSDFGLAKEHVTALTGVAVIVAAQ